MDNEILFSNIRKQKFVYEFRKMNIKALINGTKNESIIARAQKPWKVILVVVVR